MMNQDQELDGAELDAAVAAALGWKFGDLHTIRMTDGRPMVHPAVAREDNAEYFGPSQLWEHGGPIIERERIAIVGNPYSNTWDAFVRGGCFGPDGQLEAENANHNGNGPTPLVAAMRAFVASKG